MTQELLKRGKGIKLAIFDVDGVLTDGRLYFLEDGSDAGRTNLRKMCIGIGRIPVKSAAEATETVQKISDYISNPDMGNWKTRIMMIADDGDSGIHMRDSNDAIDSLRQLLDDLAALLRLLGAGHSQFTGLTCFLSGLLDVAGDLIDRRGHLVHRRGGLVSFIALGLQGTFGLLVEAAVFLGQGGGLVGELVIAGHAPMVAGAGRSASWRPAGLTPGRCPPRRRRARARS